MRKQIMTNNAIKYTIAQLLKIANPNNNLVYDITIHKERNQVVIYFIAYQIKVIFNLVEDKAWYDLINNRCDKLPLIKNAKDSNMIPVLFWVNKDLPFMSIKNDKEIIFNGDIISSSFFMLSRWEEMQAKDLDIHGRFKYENSIACKHNFITIPIVDEYAMLMRALFDKIFPDIDLGKNKFKIKLSHDIDEVRIFKDFKNAIRTLGSDLIKTKNLNIFVESVRHYVNSYNHPERDPYYLAILKLAKLSKKYNMDSSFYFSTAQKSKFDCGYIIDEHVRKCIFDLQEMGFEIGFHPGYNAFNNFEKFMDEKVVLDKVLEHSRYGGRQHYLRFDVNTTWKIWDKAGLLYDSTVGYAEHEGFRCGTCHQFNPYDIEEDKVLNVIEIPIIVMDVTLYSYRNLTSIQGLNSIIALMNKCNAVEGIFTLLWHNTSTCRGWKKWMDEVYQNFLNISNRNIT